MPTTTIERPIQKYFKTHDPQYIAEDAVYINMGTGEEIEGRKAITQMLHYFYHIAFEARAETINTILTEDKALLEGYFIGRHIGEFAGIPPTGRAVRVPLIVSYELENELIKKARIYMLESVLMKQLRINN